MPKSSIPSWVSIGGAVAFCLALVSVTGFLVKISENVNQIAETLQEVQATANEDREWIIGRRATLAAESTR